MAGYAVQSVTDQLRSQPQPRQLMFAMCHLGSCLSSSLDHLCCQGPLQCQNRSSSSTKCTCQMRLLQLVYSTHPQLST